jgi:ABC-type multidrug transport system fused ATPase/permease subunit
VTITAIGVAAGVVHEEIVAGSVTGCSRLLVCTRIRSTSSSRIRVVVFVVIVVCNIIVSISKIIISVTIIIIIIIDFRVSIVIIVIFVVGDIVVVLVFSMALFRITATQARLAACYDGKDLQQHCADLRVRVLLVLLCCGSVPFFEKFAGRGEREEVSVEVGWEDAEGEEVEVGAAMAIVLMVAEDGDIAVEVRKMDDERVDAGENSRLQRNIDNAGVVNVHVSEASSFSIRDRSERVLVHEVRNDEGVATGVEECGRDLVEGDDVGVSFTRGWDDDGRDLGVEALRGRK